METSSRDEIDIQELAVRVIRYFRNHLLFILLSCLLGVVLGVVTFKALPNKFESQMVILSDLLTKTYGDRINKSLNGLLKEKNYAELGRKLGLPADKVSSIASINMECLPDVKAPQRTDIEKDETYFIVTIDVEDLSSLPELQEGMLYFFRNNDLVKIAARQREELSRAVISKTDRELRSIDSLKRLLFQRGSFKSESLMFDPAQLFVASVDLTKRRWEAQRDLELASSIHLVEGFTAFQKPKDPNLVMLMVIGFTLGLFGAIGFLTVKHLFNLARS